MSDPSWTLGSAVSALGPFFAFETHAPGSAVRRPWRPMGELVASPEVLAGRVEGVRVQLAARAGQPAEAVQLRVAASVAQLGLVARLVSPALAAAALYGRVLPVGLGGARWQPLPGGLFPLSLPAPSGPPDAPEPVTADESELARLAAELAGTLLDGPARELVRAVAALSVSPQVLWGNVASAVNGAVTVLAGSPGADRAQAHRARRLGALLLDRPVLRAAAGRDGDGRFRRRNCCLIYRAAPAGAGGLCGDCVLALRRPRQHR